jgi:hypothetical protein
MLFGKDVYWNLKEPLLLQSEGFIGYPINSFSKIDSGDYFIQALYDVDTFSFSRNAPRNLYSMPIRVHIDKADKQVFKITSTNKLRLLRLMTPNIFVT